MQTLIDPLSSAENYICLGDTMATCAKKPMIVTYAWPQTTGGAPIIFQIFKRLVQVLHVPRDGHGTSWSPASYGLTNIGSYDVRNNVLDLVAALRNNVGHTKFTFSPGKRPLRPAARP